MLSLFINFLLAINVIVSLLIIFIVLMQRPKSEGLGAAFGGGMTENLFGAQTSNVLANFTRWLGGLFFMLTLVLSILYAKQSRQHSAIQAAAIRAAAEATPEPSAAPASSAALSGTAALSGSPGVSGTARPALGASRLNLAVPAGTPANALLPAPTLGVTPAPVVFPSPASSGTASH